MPNGGPPHVSVNLSPTRKLLFLRRISYSLRIPPSLVSFVNAFFRLSLNPLPGYQAPFRLTCADRSTMGFFEILERSVYFSYYPERDCTRPTQILRRKENVYAFNFNATRVLFATQRVQISISKVLYSIYYSRLIFQIYLWFLNAF